MAEAVFQCFFSGYSTTFRQNRQPFSGKPGDPAGTNTAGKNDLLRGKNKVEWNCRHMQGAQQIKSRSCRTKKEPPHFLSGIPYGLANGGRFTFPEHSLSGPCCSTHSHAADKKIAFNPAVELSYLDTNQQRDFLEAMNDTQNAPSLSLLSLCLYLLHQRQIVGAMFPV